MAHLRGVIKWRPFRLASIAWLARGSSLRSASGSVPLLLLYLRPPIVACRLTSQTPADTSSISNDHSGRSTWTLIIVRPLRMKPCSISSCSVSAVRYCVPDPICPNAGATTPASTSKGSITSNVRNFIVAVAGGSDRLAIAVPAGEKKRETALPPNRSMSWPGCRMARRGVTNNPIVERYSTRLALLR